MDTINDSEVRAQNDEPTPIPPLAPEKVGFDELLKLVLNEQTPPDILNTAIDSFVNVNATLDVAKLIESLPAGKRILVWHVLKPEYYWPVLTALQSDTAKHILEILPSSEFEYLKTHAKAADALALAEVLPGDLVDSIVGEQEEEIAGTITEALNYNENQVGRFVNKSVMRVRETMKVESLRKKYFSEERKAVVAIFVFDKEDQLIGQVSIRDLVVQAEGQTVASISRPCAIIEHNELCEEVVRKIQPHDDFCWYPVSQEGVIYGAISINTVVWELQENFHSAKIGESGSGEEDLFTSLSAAAKIRGVWLVINLMTAFLASWVIGWFEGTLQQVVALAILMPVVASMGGIAGSQTLAVAIRGLTLNHLSDANIKLLLQKEIKIGLLNGVILGVIIAIVVAYWFDSVLLGLVICIAIVVNNLAAAASGTCIPFVLKKLKIDPAISGSVILTTVTDVVGFVVFLGLGSILLVGLT